MKNRNIFHRLGLSFKKDDYDAIALFVYPIDNIISFLSFIIYNYYKLFLENTRII